MKEKKIYQIKYVVSGSVIERYTYEKNQFVGFEPKNKNGKNKNGITTSENRAFSLGRARKIVMRTINSNPCLNKFLTLTFEENITDLDYANNELKKWIKRVNYQVFKTKKSEMKYVAVIEFQKRGAVHYHILCNLPYIDVNSLAETWGHGFIKLNRIKGDKGRFGSDECDNVGAYVCKYMTKDNDDERLIGRNTYLMSRNLDKPQEIYVGINEKDLLQQVYGLDDGVNLGSLTSKANFSSMYTNDYTGTVVYNQFNLKRMKKQE
jgi:hypothetical protein